MLLAFDVGNTNTVIGLFDSTSGAMVEHWRANTDVLRTGDEWHVLLDSFLQQKSTSLSEVHNVIIGSVVTAVTGSLQRMCSRLSLDAITVDWQTDTGVKVLLDDPSEIGADRLANAVAAIDLGPLPAIVVDMGTATTFDVINEDGAYLGGVIMPGLGISLDALFDRASALRRFPLVVPATAVGASTKAAVQSGATFGYAAQIDGLAQRIQDEIGPCVVHATGGLSSLIAPVSRQISKHDPWLTLRGFALIAQRLHSQTENQELS